jgi:hypothetical protein
MLIKILIFIVVQLAKRAYRNLSDLDKNGKTWNIKVKVMRLWESVNNKTDQLVSFDMILMDEKVVFLSIYISLELLHVRYNLFSIFLGRCYPRCYLEKSY